MMAKNLNQLASLTAWPGDNDGLGAHVFAMTII
jgi:hypothetical protein